MFQSSGFPRLKGLRIRRSIISYAVWAYHRFALSTAGVEDLLGERGIFVSRETTRKWVTRFCRHFARCICRPGDAGEFVREGDRVEPERLHGAAQFDRWTTQTFVVGLTHNALIAPWVIPGPMNGSAFETYIETQLTPQLAPGTVVLLDNLSTHKNRRRHRH